MPGNEYLIEFNNLVDVIDHFGGLVSNTPGSTIRYIQENVFG